MIEKNPSNLFRNRLPQSVSYFPHLDTGQRCYGFQETAHLSACSPQLNKGLDSWMQYQPWKCSTPAPPWLLTQSAETKNGLSLDFAVSEVPQQINTSWTCSKNHRSLRMEEYFEVEGTGSWVQLLSGIEHTVAPNLNETAQELQEFDLRLWVTFSGFVSNKKLLLSKRRWESLQQAKECSELQSDLTLLPHSSTTSKFPLPWRSRVPFDRDLVFTDVVCSAWHDV